MGAVLGLAFGVGLVLMGSVFVLPGSPSRVRSSGRLAELLGRAGVGAAGPNAVVALCVLGALVGFVALQGLSGTLPVAVAFALMGGYLPIAFLRGRARRRQREFAAVWPEVVDHVASGVRAGLGLAEALSDLALRGPPPLRSAFAAFSVDYQTSGRLTDALDRLKEQLADPVGDRVVEALRIARDVGGGDLGRLLRNLSTFLRDDARTRAELEARQAWTVNGARLAVAAPWLVLVMLSFQPQVIGRYASAEGMVVLAVGGGLCVASYVAMIRIGRLPVEGRVLQ